jgi:hypothetical protein
MPTLWQGLQDQVHQRWILDWRWSYQWGKTKR